MIASRHAAAAALLGVLAAAVPGPPATAAPKPGGLTWSVKPSGPKGPSGRDYFVYSVSPGQRIRDRVSVTNLSDRALTFRIYATDAFNTVDGSFTLLTADRRPTDLGTWIAFTSGTRTIKPGRRADLPFTLTVPGNATPGDHSGGVIAAITEQTTTAQGRQVNIDRRVAARVYLRVNGALTPALQVESLKVAHSKGLLGTGTATVTYRIRNAGNTRQSATARIALTGPFNMSLGRRATRRMPELLPGNSYTITDRISGVPQAGPLKATLKLTPLDPGDATAARSMTRTASWWTVPWLPIVLVLVVTAVLVVAVRRRRTAAS